MGPQAGEEVCGRGEKRDIRRRNIESLTPSPTPLSTPYPWQPLVSEVHTSVHSAFQDFLWGPPSMEGYLLVPNSHHKEIPKTFHTLLSSSSPSDKPSTSPNEIPGPMLLPEGSITLSKTSYYRKLSTISPVRK